MLSTDLNIFFQILLYGCLIIVLMISSATDLRHRKIPNLLTFPTIVIALISYSFVGGMEGFLFSLYGLAAGFILFFVPFIMGGMGAGDVKLMCAVGAVIGFSHILGSILFIAIVGGLMSVVAIVLRRSFKRTILNIFNACLFMGIKQNNSFKATQKSELVREGIPFGIAISGGVFLYFIYLVLNKQPLPFFVVS